MRRRPDMDARQTADVRLARNLRSRPTDAERALWHRLNRRQLEGHKFRRQVVIGPYIVDFACLPRQLIVEVDGRQHMDPDGHETARTAWLESQGYRIVRFWSNDVLRNTDGVVQSIHDTLG